MIDKDEPDERHTIPRWLSLHQSRRMGELDGLPQSTPSAKLETIIKAQGMIDEEFNRSLLNWKTSPDEPNAEELLSIALIGGQTNDIDVMRAAEFLTTLADPTSYITKYAQNLIHNSEPFISALPLEVKKIRIEIANQKRLLRYNPRDSLRLTETALLYASIGHNKSSRSFLRRALILTPDHRYVLRSASRFFVHINEHEYAFDLLEASARTKNDPWLHAASLAIGATIDHKSQNWRKAKNLLKNANFSSRALSELAVQVGTLELNAGSRKQALRMLRQGAESPTENAIAQIEWLSRNKKIFTSEEFIVDISQSHEASAYDAYEKGDWQAAFSRCVSWHEIESFSVRPTIFGSFIAAITSNNINEGLELANTGLIANPRNITLLNNAIVLQACSGRLTDAWQTLNKAFSLEHDTTETIMLTATRGLVNFRTGNYENGIADYTKAINLATEKNAPALAIRAYCFMARELSRVDIESSTYAQGEIDKIFQIANKKGYKIATDLNYIYKEIKNKNDVLSSLNLANIPKLSVENFQTDID